MDVKAYSKDKCKNIKSREFNYIIADRFVFVGIVMLILTYLNYSSRELLWCTGFPSLERFS